MKNKQNKYLHEFFAIEKIRTGKEKKRKGFGLKFNQGRKDPKTRAHA